MNAQLRFYDTAPYPCSYLPEQTACAQVVSPTQAIHAQVYNPLVHLGFRRSGTIIYRPHCAQCQACMSLRIPVHTFEANQSQRRAWRAHQHLVATARPLAFDQSHYDLYQRYQASRHANAGMDQDSAVQYSEFLLQSPVDSLLIEFTDPQAFGPSALKIVCVIDLLADGLSAVYTFFEPEPQTSYGTFAVLWQIEQAKQRGLAYCYLGYWIAQSPKMAYKARFKPHELLRGQQWVRA